ncbi:DNA topoisomerase IB [Flavitalea flava]
MPSPNNVMPDSEISLSHKEYLKTDRDYEGAATAINLIYSSDRQSGISRIKKGKGFLYRLEGKKISDKKELERIRKLIIPPSWTGVWICPHEKGHIQATGLDLKGRKQYRYHSLWNRMRSETKFHRLYEFGKAIPVLREKVSEDLKVRGLSQEKILATVISLMERTYIRIGSIEYEKMYGSYGLTTMKNRHVSISGDKIIFSFTGKKGVHHDITLHNKRLALIVRQCREIPGKELFQYYMEDGTKRNIDSGMVNEYIKRTAAFDFTAKDFRTWAGSLHALQAFRDVGEALNDTDSKKNLSLVLDTVSKKLGNTRTVCRKYYIHPCLLQLYEENELMKYLSTGDEDESVDNETGLSTDERILMKILKKYITLSALT